MHLSLKFKFIQVPRILVDNPSYYGIPWSGYPMKHTLTLDCWNEVWDSCHLDFGSSGQIVTVCECCTGASGSSAGGLLHGPSCWEFPIMGDAQPVPRKCKCNSSESAHFHLGSLGTYTELSYNPLLCSTFLNRITHALPPLLTVRKHSSNIGRVSAW